MSDDKMTYRPLGRSGTKVSTFSLGGWTTYGGSISDDVAVKNILHAAHAAGVNFFDIADVYAHGGAEHAMGHALADIPRHHLVLSTKCYWPMSDDVNDRGLSRKHIMESVEHSLKRMGTDYIDILFCHRYDEDTPLDETVRAMEDLIRQGKILYWGTSEWTAEQLRDACALADRYGAYAPQVEQPQYSLAARRKMEGAGVRTTIDELGMGLVVWSPLASGLLTGKYDDGIPADSRLERIEWLRPALLTDENLDRVRQMKALADEAGCTRTQLALAWAAAQPGISSVILGATSTAQLEENLGALRVDITDELGAQLDALFPVSASID